METEKTTRPDDALTLRNEAATSLSDRKAGRPGRAFARAMSSMAPADSLFVVLWRSRWIVLICFLAAVDGGIAYLRNVTPIYTSTAKLYLDYAGIRISNPYDPGSRPQTDKYLCTQAELIKSRPILTSVEETLTPRQLRTLAEADVPPTAYLQRNMTVEIGKKDEVISITLRSPYPAEAAEIVNCVMGEYLKSLTEHEQRSAAQVLRALQAERQRVDQALEEKSNELTVFRRDHVPLVWGSDQTGGVTQPYSDYRNAQTQAEIRRIEAESFLLAVRDLAQNPTGLRQYVQLKGNSGITVTGDPEKAALETRIIDLKHQRETLLKTVTSDWPNVRTLTGEIDTLGGKLKELDDQFVKAVLAAADKQYMEAKDSEDRIAQLYREQEKQGKLLNEEIDQYQRLRAEQTQLTLRSQTLEQEIGEIRKLVNEDMGQLRMSVLEQAQPAALPSEPQAARVMAMALILGLLLGGGAAVARDWLNQTLRSADEISAVLHVPVLGAVPAMSRCRRVQDRGRKVLLQPDSHEAEAFRTIRTAVLFGASPEGAKTMLVTSPAAGDGKSTLVSNLAIALANAGQKTLILDADFRKPTQHVIFGLDPHERCLSDVFDGTMTLAAAVQPSGIEGLHVLTGGYRIANPAEVLNSQRFAHVLTCLTDVYDRIVVDAPPVTVVTDAQILGALCDATVLVLKADKSVRKVALHAVDALEGVGARLLGVVVNEVRKRGQRYGYYYDRYHRYYDSRARRSGMSRPKSRVPAATLRVATSEVDACVLPVKTASEGA